MSHKIFYRLTVSFLVTLLSLGFVSKTSALDSNFSQQTVPAAALVNTSAVLSNDLVTEGSPVMYTINFNHSFASISEVDYFFIFGADPLDQWEELMFTGDFPGGFGFVNPNVTPQTTRLLGFPCSIHPEVCDAFMDGFSQGEITISLSTGSGSPSVRISSLIVYVYGTTSVDVNIDIKPGSETNPINTTSKGKIPVAILSTSDFDAPSMVDKTSLTFGKTGDEASLAFCNKGTEDVNDDGLSDLVCHFYTQATGFQFGETEGILKGQTVDGSSLKGSDSITIVNESSEEFNVCPFEPVMITLTSPDPVKVPVQITTSGQDLNFGADDPPGVFWALTELNNTILFSGGPDDHFHFTWGPYNFSDPGYYYVVFSHPEAGTTYPTIQINLACDYEAPEP